MTLKPDTAASQGGMAALPLAGIVVLDLTRALAGPACVRLLADWGADVISINPPGSTGEDTSGNRDSGYFQNLHRNKRQMWLDLKSPAGLAVFMRMARTADVIVENMRPSVKRKLKIDWDDIRAVNPRLVYGSISGFGQDGPYASRAGVDQIAQGMSGLMSVTGVAGQGPMRAGIAVADMTAGNLLAFGVMTALFERHRTGTGRWVHTSLLEALVYMLDFQAARWLVDKVVPAQAGNDHPTGTPTGMFPTSDGHVNIAAAGTRIWDRFCDAMERPDWKARAAWRTGDGRLKDRPEINAQISEMTRRKSSAHWAEALNRAGVPCGPIYTIDQTFNDPQVRHLRMTRPVTHPRLGEQTLLASGVNIDGASKDIRTATAEPGADTGAVLRQFGYDAAEISALQAQKII